MTPAAANFDLPPGITEADLVDLVDGCLASDREQQVVALVSQHPHLGIIVADMRSDRAGLAALAHVYAPPGMADEIEARLRSEALRGLISAAETTSGPIPISSIRVKRPSVLPAIFESVWTRRLAMAATVALLAGGGAWGVLELVRHNAPATPIEIARDTPINDTTPEPTPEPAPIDIATINNADAVALGMPPTLTAEETGMSHARAAALAREGRLVITIHTTDSRGAIKRLDTLAKAGAREGWKAVALDAVPTQLAALMTPSSSHVIPGGTLLPDRAIASDKPANTTGTPQQLPDLRNAVRGIYTADVNPGERWLSGLIRTVTDALPESAILELREGPYIAPAESALEPDSVLWWNAPPARWAKKTTVPIVVEGLQ